MLAVTAVQGVSLLGMIVTLVIFVASNYIENTCTEELDEDPLAFAIEYEDMDTCKSAKSTSILTLFFVVFTLSLILCYVEFQVLYWGWKELETRDRYMNRSFHGHRNPDMTGLDNVMKGSTKRFGVGKHRPSSQSETKDRREKFA